MRLVLLWFRRNLPLSDNAALIAAAEYGRPIIPVYILDDQDVGGASRWWLQRGLTGYPIVDHAAARQRALEAYRSIKGMRTSKLAP